MDSEIRTKPEHLYDQDYQCWLDQTVAQLRTKDFGNLDLENLIEEIESLGKSDKRAILSFLTRLCEYLLKLKYWQLERRDCFRGWVQEINNFRAEIELILKDSPSFNRFLAENFVSVYQKARKNLLQLSSLPADLIPEEPEFTLEQALNEDWLPWKPE